jgi:hypothetical protein
MVVFIFLVFLLILIIPSRNIGNKSNESKKDLDSVYYLSKVLENIESGLNYIDSINKTLKTNYDYYSLNMSDFSIRVKNGQISEREQTVLSEILKVTYKFSKASGSSISSTLRSTIQTIRDENELQSELKVITSGPKSTVKVLKFLPLVSILLASLVGVNIISVVVSSPIALVSVLLGAVFSLLGNYWTKKIMTPVMSSVITGGK